MRVLVLSIILLLALGPSPVAALDLPSLVKDGGVRVEDSSGKAIIRYRDAEPFIPASTLKIATALCALETLGEDYRFITHFYTSTNKSGPTTLYLKASGDPGMVSEELEVIARQLSQYLSRIDEIVIDTSLFSPNLVIDGVSASTNPYDARNAAFVGNFSSALVTRLKSGRVISAEAHTPLTPLAEAAGARLPPGVTERVNLGRDWKLGPLYGGELLAAFLRNAGMTGEMSVTLGELPSSAKKLYSHASSQPLRETVRGLLQFSTNFTANQLFLVLGEREYGAPATLEKGQKAISTCLSRHAEWDGIHIEEGSGLSRKSKVSARDMTRLLAGFARYKDLLKMQDGFLAKTGTLTGVNTLAGYFSTKRHGEVRFAVLVNTKVPHNYKYTVAEKLRAAIDAQ